MLIPHKGHTDTIQVYSVTVMTHVKALQAGHASQGTSEPITPAHPQYEVAGLYMYSISCWPNTECPRYLRHLYDAESMFEKSSNIYCRFLFLTSIFLWKWNSNPPVAPSNVTMPLYVKRWLNVKKISTLNVKIDAICEKFTLNVKKVGSLNVSKILTLNVLKSTLYVQTLFCRYLWKSVFYSP